MSLLNDTYCVYCQRDYSTQRKLQNHILKEHENTYVAGRIYQLRTAERIDPGMVVKRGSD